MKKIKLFFVTIISLQTFAQKIVLPKITNTFHLASAGGWDYISILPNSNKLYVPHGIQVNILDKKTGDSLGIVTGTTGVHGVAFNITKNKGYTSNGKINTVSVFDLTNNIVLSQIAVGENPDAILYDVITNQIITCNGRSNNISFIDATTEKVTNTVAVSGKPETLVTNGKGLFFVNIEDKNEIAVIDNKTKTVIKSYSLLPGEAPTGLVYDNKSNHLFAGCGDNAKLIIIDATNGKIVDSFAIDKGCDGVAFDTSKKLIYTSNGNGSISVIKQDTKYKYKKLADVITKKGTRTLCIDNDTNTIYMPTADFEELKPGEKRAKWKPNSFQVVVLQ